LKKFNFNLQKALNLRKFKEDECKIALGQATGVLTSIENEINETALRRQDAEQKRFSGSEDISLWDNYIMRLDQNAEELEQDAQRARLVVEEKKAAFIEASRDVKALEKLKEKRAGEHRKRMFASETQEMDFNFSARQTAKT